MTSLKYMNMLLESLQRKKIDSFLFAFSGLIRMITVIWFFRFVEFEPIKLYLCSQSSCQCRLIYARKNIETQTATKYFITGTKNFKLDWYPFAGNDALTGLVFWKNWYFSFTHWKYWLHLKMDVFWERGEDMMWNNDLK